MFSFKLDYMQVVRVNLVSNETKICSYNLYNKFGNIK